MMRFLQKLISDLNDTDRLKEGSPFIRKQIGRELQVKLPSQTNTFKIMPTLKMLTAYGINSSQICMQLLINTSHIRPVPRIIGPHGFLLRYVNY